MSKILINFKTSPVEPIIITDHFLRVSELFTQTLQGEGVYIGAPATFLRTGGCHVGCKFCDSTLIWRNSKSFKLSEILDILFREGVIDRFREGEHLVITGGAPLLQADAVVKFIEEFEREFNFIPFIQVENECTIDPPEKLINYVSCWNNSPKLKNAEVEQYKRYKPRVIKKMSSIDNSWFKFVVGSLEDWDEIEMYYLKPKLIKKDQIILMPKGYCQDELSETRLMVAELAIEKNVKFSDRLQITLYNTKVSV